MEYIPKALRVEILKVASSTNGSGTLKELKNNYKSLIDLINEQ